MSWLRRKEKSLQPTVEADVDSVEQDGVPLLADELVEVVPVGTVTQSGQSSGPNGGPGSTGPVVD